MLRFNHDEEPRLSSYHGDQQTWWDGMFGGEPEPEGPRTIGEWMEQDRLKP